MSQFSRWLSGGDLRSDGRAPEIAEIVLQDRSLLEDLLGCLDSDDAVVRGRAADAVERVARLNPGWLLGEMPRLLSLARSDPVPMVRWHMAMILGYLAVYPEWADALAEVLLELLQDDSVFVRSWAIVSACILARWYPERADEITDQITHLQHDKSIAVRSKVRKALSLLVASDLPFPKGWLKSPHHKELE